MRLSRPVLILAISAGCSSAGSIEGDLLDSAAADQISIEGGERVSLEGGAFRIPYREVDTLTLRFALEEEIVGTMTISGLRSASGVALRRVWFDQDLAFPSQVEVNGNALVTINDIRMGPPDRVSGPARLTGTILASDGRDGLFLVRPADPSLPDVAAVLAPAARMIDRGGERLSLERLRFGDTIQLSGTGEGAYLFVTDATVSLLPEVATSPGTEQRSFEPLPTEAVEDPRGNENDRDRAREKQNEPERGRGRGRPRLGRFSPGSR